LSHAEETSVNASDRERELIRAARADAEDCSLSGMAASSLRSGDERAASIASGSLAADSFAGYEILGEIHRGGQGVVYQAFQKATKRNVAVKVLREGPFAGPADKARFDREVQILGQLQHPHIVAIHDSGESAGHFFYVMDYIAGQPLDLYLAGREWSIRESLELFARICEAVNAAHLRGIIHRDLKPGNIRVDADGHPHILDFGLAKVATTDSELAAMTQTGQFVGSLPWASPEQAEGAPGKIDVRTDVYSLGVILYQMLTGRFPYEVIGNMRDVLDRIMKAEPIRPSTLRRQINDEVETIVLKCLAKERERRYQSAGELARDVRHYLAGEPIEAKRDSVGYVLRKQLRRYRLPLAVACGFTLIVTIGLISSLTYWRQAARERDAAQSARIAESQQRAIAEQQRDKANQVAEFMSQTLAGVGPSVALGRDTTMLREMLDSAAARITAGELSENPEAELRLCMTVGDTYREIAAFDGAEQMLAPSEALARSTFGQTHSEVAAAMNYSAMLLQEQGKATEALPKFESALEMYARVYRGDHRDVADSLNNLAICLQSLGRAAEALPRFQAALEMRQRIFPGDHPLPAQSLNNVGDCLLTLGRAADALARHEAALEMRRRLHKGDHPDVAGSLTNVASCLQRLGRGMEALEKDEAALNMQQRLFKGDHPSVAKALNNVAASLQYLDRRKEALPTIEAALEMHQRLFRGDHPVVATGLNNLAYCLLSLGRAEEALPRAEAGLAMRKRLLPQGHINIARSESMLGRVLAKTGRYEESLPLLIAASDTLLADPGASNSERQRCLEALVVLFDRWHAAEPGKGYDDKAAEWRRKLSDWQATTQPTVTQRTASPSSN
jgi:tetratricopeptide (TPR) repeat protein